MLAVLMAERSMAAPLWRLARWKDPRGRKGGATEEALLAGMYLNYWDERRLQMSRVDRRLQGLEPAVREYLGVRAHPRPQVTREGRRSRLDDADRPIGEYKRRESNVAEPLNRLSTAMAEPITWSRFGASARSEAERIEAWALQRALLDRIVAGFLPASLPAPDMLSIDATGIRSFAETAEADVDAGVVYQTPTRRDPQEILNNGYYGTAVVGRNLDTNYEYPLIAFHFVLTTWHDYGHQLDDPAILLLDSFARTRGDGLIVVVDADYSYKLEWSRRVRNAGFNSIHDLNSVERRRPGQWHGFQTLGPELYCFKPELTDLGSPTRDGVDLLEYNIARSEQLRYAAQILELDRDYALIICPAQGESPTVRCACHAASLALSRATEPTVIDSPHPGSERECCRGPVTLDLASRRAFAKGFQHLPIGSDRWREYFTPGRTGVEAYWGNLFGENGGHAVVGATNWVEQAQTAWVYAVILGIENVKALRVWWYKPHVRERLPSAVREELEQDPILWPMDRLADLYRARFA